MTTATMPTIRSKPDIRRDFTYQTFDDLPIYDQRYFPRWKTSNKVYYRIKNGHLIAASKLRDMHLGGACFYVDGHVHVNQTFELKIFLDKVHSFDVAATVMWKLGQGDDSIAGVAFEPLDQTAQDLILEYAFENIREIAYQSISFEPELVHST